MGLPSSAASEGKSEESVSILIIDDNAAKRTGLRAVLEPLGHTIVEADSGLAGLRCVVAQEFAVILLDVRMPGMDGFETAALIRQRWQSEMTPIIFITAHAKDEILNPDLYAEGAVDFIFAPVPPDELRSKVTVFVNLFLRAAELAERAREVQASVDELRLLTDAAPIGIFQTDAELRYVYTNPRWSDLTGIAAGDAVGKVWDSLLGAGPPPGFIVDRADSDEHPDELSYRAELTVEGSRTLTVLVTSQSIPDSQGAISGWVGTLADVTDEAAAQAILAEARDNATAASKLKSDFLANMSHEIRTPLNGVIGMTDLLLDTDLEAEQRDYAMTVRNSGDALLRIIDDILDFSKVEAGMLELEQVELNVRTVVGDVMDLLKGSAHAKALGFQFKVEDNVEAVVTGDPGRIRQVLTNLVGNAVKFTRSGEIVVRVAEVEHVGDEAVLRFEVSDTGCGIPLEKQASIFDPFVQADTSTSRQYGGTGLGLAICGQLVGLMGGKCGVASTPGRGSTFWFTIRVGASGPEATPINHPRLAGLTCLIVDDDADRSAMLSEHLTDWGMVVAVADSEAGGLDMLLRGAATGNPITVALLDHSTPGVNGLGLASAIHDEDALDVVVFVMGCHEVFSAPGVSKFHSRPTRFGDLHADLQAAIPPREPKAVKPCSGRLLLAEDNLINQKVALAMLSSGGYSVDTVLDGVAAVQAAGEQHYDAILMDCQMPMLNGYEATAAIRLHEGDERHTPIIAMTAGARREDRASCFASGMDSYISKPVTKERLLATVAAFVNGRVE